MTTPTEVNPDSTDPAGVSRRMGGSFRDPSGYVFERAGRVFRAIDASGEAVLRRLMENGTLERLISEGRVVPTTFVENRELKSELAREHPDHDRFVEHAPLWPITYPYEWPISMLADAAVWTLDLQEELLRHGLSLKDASAYNIQFPGCRPVFIDIGSFEQPARLDVWFALGQFQRMFLYPLLLCRHYGWDLASYFMSAPEGRDLEQMRGILSPLQRLHPRLWLDLTLPLWLNRRADRRRGTGQDIRKARSGSPESQILLLRRAKARVRALAWGYRPKGAWTEYREFGSYGEQAEAAKKEAVERILRSEKPRRVLDLGCNTGDFSRIAAARGAQVVAADADHDVVELLYRTLRDRPASVTPVVLNALNPTPALGFRNRERPNFAERVNVDCVLALALMHHLLVAGNIGLAGFRDLLCDFTSRTAIVEFVPPEDPMFRRLLRYRVDLFQDLTLEGFIEIVRARFDVEQRIPIAGSARTLLLLRRRG